MFARLAGWAHRHLPTRESLERNRLLRPVAHRVLAPALWRFTRRSVPRGVALGMVTGILFPVAQVPLSALLALPVRANIPTAALTTLITNPLTTPPLWVAAYWLGSRMLRYEAEADVAVRAGEGWLHWLVSQAGPSLVVGLLTITLILAATGFAASTLGWRWWIVRKWRARAIARSAGPGL